MSSRPENDLAPDCRYYTGLKPCHKNRLCAGCNDYAPHPHRVCVVKLGALGDVIRTLCILPEIHRRWPDVQVTWVSEPSGCRMIKAHPLIHRAIEFNTPTVMALRHERFDAVISMDKEPEPCALAMDLRAPIKLGVALSAWGTAVPFTPDAQHYMNLGISDELKFNQNQKSYPQLIYESLGFEYAGQSYELPVSEDSTTRVHRALNEKGWRVDRKTLGINVGAGHRFANKMWPAKRICEVIQKIQGAHANWQILLLGGPSERDIVDQILLYAEQESWNMVYDAGTNWSEPDFVAVIDSCDALFCGDTMALHVAIARQKPTVVLFGPTCHQEIDVFNRGSKLIGRVPCGPCYKRVCDHDDACVEAVSVDGAVQAIEQALDTAPSPMAP